MMIEMLPGIGEIATANRWSEPFAQGFVDGAIARRRGRLMSRAILVTIDDYGLGFRAGYFQRMAARGSPIPEGSALARTVAALAAAVPDGRSTRAAVEDDRDDGHMTGLALAHS